MKTVIRTLVILVLVWIGVVLSGVLPRATPVQREAVALMQQPSPSLGSRNGYAALWLSAWDVPPADREALMTADIDAWAKYRDGTDKSQPFASSAKGRYPTVVHPSASEAALCQPWSPCLERVRQDTATDYVGRFVAVLGLSLPDFWLATVAITFLAIWFAWIPPIGFAPRDS